MYPHRIRLRGPWQCEPLARHPHSGESQRGEPLPAPCRVTMPCRWLETPLGEFTGQVRCRRRFGYPGRIDAHERVFLTFDGWDGAAEISLNGASLGRREGSTAPFEFDVTSLLNPRNELVVDIDDATGRGGLWGEVALEIRCQAWLKNVHVRIVPMADAARLQVEGSVTGTAEQPLELYVVLGRYPVLYSLVTAAPEGEPFSLSSELLTQSWPQAREIPVRVELVNGATPWYTFDTVVISH